MATKRILLQKDIDEYLNKKLNTYGFEIPVKFSAPISLIWEITGKCNSKCLYCSGGFPKVVKEISKQEKINLAKEICDMKVFMISISGGEPLVNEDLLDIVSIFSDNDVPVMICTSGYNINYEILSKLLKIKGIAFNVSIDSVDAEVNDYQRGRKGALNEALKLIEFIRENEKECSFMSIEAVATKNNYSGMSDLVKFFNENYSINEIRIQPMVTMNQKVIQCGLDINAEEFQLCVTNVNGFISKYNDHVKDDNLGLSTCVRFIDQFKLIENGLRTGRTWGGVITPDGNFLLSVYLPSNLGSIYQDGSFKTTWDNRFSCAWRNFKEDLEQKSIKNLWDLKRLYV